MESGLLYKDSPHHNCVFVGREDSDKSAVFRLPCNFALDWMTVFEAPIDLVSFCLLHRQVRSNTMALCRPYQEPLDTYLWENPHLKQIILCLDADRPGQLQGGFL